MPLFKKKQYELSNPPDDLKPKDLVFQVRITKEIFKDYQEYLNRINLYSQRVWTCKVTGKGNLTYEEALLSEAKATEKVQQFPKEFMGPVLQLVQFSTLRLDELVSAIVKTFKDRFVVEEEVLYVRKDVTKACRIIAVDENPQNGIRNYIVGWLDNQKKITGSSIVQAENLVRRKVPPFTRSLLKSFIRESVKDKASRNSQTPLVVLESLCHKYGLRTDPPEELKKFFNKQLPNHRQADGINKRSLVDIMEAGINLNKKPKMMVVEQTSGENAHHKGKKTATSVIQETPRKSETTQDYMGKSLIDQQPSRKTKVMTKTAKTPQEDNKDKTPQQDYKKEKKSQAKTCREDVKNVVLDVNGKEANNGRSEFVAKAVRIKYPIEDSLVEPSPDDSILPNKPVPLSDFSFPMDCIGPLLMVWNFCTLFEKVIKLSPFSLEDLGKAVDCKEKEHMLLKEAHHALIKLVLSDLAISKAFPEIRTRKAKMTIHTWKDDFCYLSKLEGFEYLLTHAMAINEVDYVLLEPATKLDILCGLVNCALGSSEIREQLDIYIEEKQAIAAEKRKEEMESLKREKEVQEQLKQQHTEVSLVEPNSNAQRSNVAEDSKDERDEESMSEAGIDNEGSNLAKDIDGLPNGTQVKCYVDEEITSESARSRHDMLKIQAQLRRAEESEKERKRSEEQRRIQEVRRAKLLAVRKQKLEERKIIESYRRRVRLDREIEKRVIRTNPLGRDRDCNRYWFFPREGRIFVEDEKSATWGYYSTKEELETLFRSLNTKGIRERALQRQLEKHYRRISDSLQKRSKAVVQWVTSDDSSTRRSSRNKTTSQQTEDTYRNKYRN